jgi:hypothetical protein
MTKASEEDALMNTPLKTPPIRERIVTHYWLKPIPVRSFDWSAVGDSYEPEDPIGYGATEEEAVNDLLEQLELLVDLPTLSGN